MQYHFENFESSPVSPRGPSLLPDELVDTWLKYSSIDNKHLAARHCWFFFAIVTKSMLMHLKTHGKFGTSDRILPFAFHEMTRIHLGIPKKNQFSKSLHQNLQKLIYKFGEFINKALLRRMNIELANYVNIHVAFFLRDMLSIGHRGYVLAIIETYIDCFSAEDLNATEAKLRFLKVLADHEHYLALNLPTLTSLNPRLIARVQETFACVCFVCFGDRHHILHLCHSRQHFLSGLLLNQLKDSIQRTSAIKSLSITVVRDLMWKHDHDPRYDSPDAKQRHSSSFATFSSNAKLTRVSCRLAELYFPLIPMVVDFREDVLDISLMNVENVRDCTPSLLSSETRSFFLTSISVGLICFMFVLKNVNRELLRDWWKRDAEKRKLGLLDVLTRALEHLSYVGADALRKGNGVFASTSSISFDIMTYRSASLRGDNKCGDIYFRHIGPAPEPLFLVFQGHFGERLWHYARVAYSEQERHDGQWSNRRLTTATEPEHFEPRACRLPRLFGTLRVCCLSRETQRIIIRS